MHCETGKTSLNFQMGEWNYASGIIQTSAFYNLQLIFSPWLSCPCSCVFQPFSCFLSWSRHPQMLPESVSPTHSGVRPFHAWGFCCLGWLALSTLANHFLSWSYPWVTKPQQLQKFSLEIATYPALSQFAGELAFLLFQSPHSLWELTLSSCIWSVTHSCFTGWKDWPSWN